MLAGVRDFMFIEAPDFVYAGGIRAPPCGHPSALCTIGVKKDLFHPPSADNCTTTSHATGNSDGSARDDQVYALATIERTNINVSKTHPGPHRTDTTDHHGCRPRRGGNVTLGNTQPGRRLCPVHTGDYYDCVHTRRWGAVERLPDLGI